MVMQDSSPEPTPPQPVGDPAQAVEREALGLPPLRTEPPLLLSPRPISQSYWWALVALGLLQLVLAITASSRMEIAQRLGFIVGGTVLWPALVIGLFAMAKKGRTPRVRLWILFGVWGMFCLGHLGNIGQRNQESKAPAARTVRSIERLDLPAASSALTAQVARQTAPAPGQATPAKDASPAEFDLSPGSDKRLIKLIEAAQQDRYRATVTAYAQGCARRPMDAVLALERVRFIERFAYSEDLTMEGAEEDRETAVAYLTTRFPEAPGTVLYLLEQKYGEEMETEAKTYANLVPLWPEADQAAFALLRARAAQARSDDGGVLNHARESFRLQPTVEAGLLLAEKYLEKKQLGEGRRVLGDPVFATAENWGKKRQLVLLLKLGGSGAQAQALYEELKTAAASLVQDADVAEGLAQSGHLAAAREVFNSIVEYDWNRQKIARQRFEFELAHGDQTQAEAAYRRLRDQGLSADPMLRFRLALLWKHPGAGWALPDLAGGLVLAFFFSVMALLPLGLLVPVHYWSLRREKKGKSGGWPQALWGLRAAWLAFGLLFSMQALMMWIMAPEQVAGWFNAAERTDAAENLKVSILAMQGPTWIVMGLCLAYLFWRAQAWRLLGAGGWSLGKALGAGIGLLLLLRLGLAAYLQIFPQAMEGEIATATSGNVQLGQELLQRFGPLGLLACFAVLVPLIEEMMFRGVLLQGLGKHIPFAWANGLQAVVFAGVHDNYRLFPFYFAFGCVAGILTRRSQGLLPALIFHAGNNLLVCVNLIIAHRGAA